MSELTTKDRFNKIYDSTHHDILVFITAKCSNTHDIHDIFQETYMELYSVLCKRGNQYIRNEQAFLYKLAKQKLYRHYSLKDRLQQMLPIYTLQSEEESIIDIQVDIEILSPEDIVIEHELINHINEFLAQKPQEIIKIFYLFYGLNLTILQISKQLNVTESYVKNKLYRTLKEIRTLYT